MNPDPPLVRVRVSVVSDNRYTSVLLAVQTVWPVAEFEAQELTGLAVGIRVGVMLLPSMLTTEMPVVSESQLPFGTYDVTLEPLTRTDSELEG